ncbi:MAG: DegT/DnrJ/EryC1/StrS family aminotransferase [Actinobacteria bacterium]|nr:DegT/DnrJ/EryC1/StrS family aminotransferase [Actinomycetota bacterium]
MEPWLSVWPALRPDAWVRRPADSLPFPFDSRECRIYAFARQGLSAALEQFGIGEGDELLVPAYHHGSEIGTLRLAGVRPRWYDTTDSLAPDPDELEAALGPRVRGLYLIHNLGFAHDCPRWRRWCDERGLLLFEDVAMAWPGRFEGKPLGSWADVAIFSPWKTFGLPDSGALICGRPPAQVPFGGGVRPGEILSRHVRWLAQRSSPIGTFHPRAHDDSHFDSDWEFESGYRTAAPSRTSMNLLRRLIDMPVVEPRRANAARLESSIPQRRPAPFLDLAESCPFAYPIESASKSELLDELARHNVHALDIWSVPHPLLPVDRFPGSARLRTRVVGLPVHQELRSSHVDHMIEVLRSCHERGIGA